MRILHKTLKRDHHLKHMGRLQYGLFLKGIGLSLEGALQFWKDEFTKKMSDNEFEKGYAYNFKHMYGQVGKRTNYTPYGCMKIITGMNVPAVGECHGCPYKNFDEKNLRQALIGCYPDITSTQVDEIVDLSKKQHYQVYFLFLELFTYL